MNIQDGAEQLACSRRSDGRARVLGITNDFLYLSNSKIHELEPRYNETSVYRTNFAGPLATVEPRYNDWYLLIPEQQKE